MSQPLPAGTGVLARNEPSVAADLLVEASPAYAQFFRQIANVVAKRRCTLRSLDICINGLIFRFLGVARSENVL